MNNILAVFIGGGLGSLIRYGISVFMPTIFKTTFPVATLTSNILSCIILAITVTVVNSKAAESGNLKLLLITGLCGGFSTFSTFSYETVELMRNGNMVYAIANILISVIVCIFLVYMIAKSPAL